MRLVVRECPRKGVPEVSRARRSRRSPTVLLMATSRRHPNLKGEPINRDFDFSGRKTPKVSVRRDPQLEAMLPKRKRRARPMPSTVVFTHRINGNGTLTPLPKPQRPVRATQGQGDAGIAASERTIRPMETEMNRGNEKGKTDRQLLD